MTGYAQKLRVAFQGEHGAFSEGAAIRLLGGDIELVPRATFDTLFTAVEEGAADYALAPVENSLAGSVHWTYDLLLRGTLRIVGEIIHPIVMCLIGVPGASLESVTTVESHPVALAQCEQFFQAHPRISRIAVGDTAGAVRGIMARGDASCAAISARRAAEIYGGIVLREHLEDHSENYTRFLLLAPPGAPSKGADKLSLVFRVAHQPGALVRSLDVFARRGINLMKIESRPIAGCPWEYRFYLDLQASIENVNCATALRELESYALDLRVLGCYPSSRAQSREIEFKS